MDRGALIKKLSHLTESDFGLLRLQFPEASGQVASTGAVQLRVAQLVDFAESITGPGLDTVAGAAAELWPAAFQALSPQERTAIVQQFSDPLKDVPPVSEADFKQFVDQKIDSVQSGETSRHEIRAKLKKALPQRLGSLQSEMTQKVDTYLRLEKAPASKAIGFESVMGAAETLVPLLISVTDPNWDLANIPDLVVLARMGHVIGAKGTKTSLAALNQDFRVTSVEASTAQTDLHLECDRSMPYVKANIARQQFQVSGIDEDGGLAIVGVIDAGIDIFHHAFQKKDGTSRILAIWDQTDSTGPPPAGFELSGGTLYTESMINQYLADGAAKFGSKHPKRQFRCHGTHVASIAAGSPFKKFNGGVAPGADLLIVITGWLKYEKHMPNSLGYSLSHVVALSWLDQFAKQLPGNPPLAINMSMGQNSGAHDGTSLLELSCDQFCGNGRIPGRVIVKSAGNMRDRKSHAGIMFSPGQIDTLKWQNEPNKNPGSVRLDAWFPSHVQFRFKLQAPDGEVSKPVDWSNLVVPHHFNNGNDAQIVYTRLHPDNGLSRLVVDLQSGSAFSLANIANQPWKLEIEAVSTVTNVQFDCWVDATESSSVEFVNHADEKLTLSVPGTARTVITVGAIDISSGVKVGDFSGYGRTRDNREKPEIAAPGVDILAASSQSEDELRLESGTSMAAPHVTGAIALLFSACRRRKLPVPNVPQVAQALMNSAQGHTGTYNPGRGFGDLNVLEFLKTFIPSTPASPPAAAPLTAASGTVPVPSPPPSVTKSSP